MSQPAYTGAFDFDRISGASLSIWHASKAIFAYAYGMTSTPSINLLLPLGKQNMALLVAEAERVGVVPGDYAKSLVDAGL